MLGVQRPVPPIIRRAAVNRRAWLPVLLSLGLVSAIARRADAQQLPGNYVASGNSITQGQWLTSPSKLFFVMVQADGNLVVYAGSNPGEPTPSGQPRPVLWASNTGGHPVGKYYLTVQTNGDLCLNSGTPMAMTGNLWCTHTPGPTAPSFFAILDNGAIALYNGTDPAHVPQAAPLRWNTNGWSGAQTYAYQKSLGHVRPGPVASYVVTNPNNRACPTFTYRVPDGVTMLELKATGGTGATTGFAYPPTGGGKGAVVTVVVPVTPGQTLYGVPALSGDSTTGVEGSFPGGGKGYFLYSANGGGASFVSTVAPTQGADPLSCSTPQQNLLVIAGGGGANGPHDGLCGMGGDAGLLGGTAQSGSPGTVAQGETDPGGGGGGGSQTAGGAVGAHPGQGTELRSAGSYMRGSDDINPSEANYAGGAGGAGLWGGGGGGGSVRSGSGGGGGGSSYATPNNYSQQSFLDSYNKPGIWITPLTYSF